MQPPNNNPTPPQPAVMGSVAQPHHQPYGQPQVQAQPQVTQFTQPQMVGQPVMMQQMPGGIVMGGGYPQTSAMAAMIISIVSIFTFGICLAIPSLIMANGALAITNQTPGHPDAGTAKAAQIISWIVIGFTLAFIGIIVLMIVGAGASGGF
jgi:hypothetical protein|tara:strand:- start:613 stop:1065 length:453 start_codon:yes stop_codon:yes gene_type:complete